MATIANASVLFKDKDGNIGVLRSLSQNDITRIQGSIQGLKDLKDRVDVIIDGNGAFLAATEATDTVLGTVKKAAAADITAGTVGKVVDAAQLKSAIDDVKDEVSRVYKYKGSVATYGDLPSSGVANGDVYDVQSETVIGSTVYPAGTNFAAVVDDTQAPATISWDPLGGDVADYARKSGDNAFTGDNAFSGEVTVPTQAAGDNSTKAASTAFVADAVATAIDGVVNYSAAEPVAANVDPNTVTFYDGGDLLSDPV